MSKFQIITDIKKVPLGSEWTDAAKFNSKNKTVDELGKPVTADYKGHRYCLMAKHRAYAKSERFCRAFMATLAVICTLCLALLSKSIRNCFTRKYETLVFGMLVKPVATTTTQPIQTIVNQTLNAPTPVPKQTSQILTPQPPKTALQTPTPVIVPINTPSIAKPSVNNNAPIVPSVAIPQPPKLPPLPNLLNLILNPNHELLKEISLENFLTEPYKSTLQYLRSNGKFPQPTFNDNTVDAFILRLPLMCWVDAKVDAPLKERIMSDPARKEIRRIIQERVKQYEDTIQLSERIKRLNSKYLLDTRDLLAPFPNSKIRFALVMDDELSQMKISDIKAQDPNMINSALGKRLTDLSQLSTYDASQLKGNEIPDIKLVNIPKLTAEAVHRLAPELPLIAFYLISMLEIPKIKLSELSKEQITALLDGERIQVLKPAQINENMDKIPVPSFEKLSEDQIKGLDFTKLKKEMFEAIFGKSSCRNEKILNSLKLNKIYELIKHFSPHHWKEINEDRILKFDLSKMDEEGFKAVFELHHPKTSRLLEALDLKEIYKVTQFFEISHWTEIGEKHMLNLDFSKIDEDIFNAIFAQYHPRTTRLIQGLKLNRIYEIMQYFTLDHWKQLSDKQILEELDFSKIDEDIFNAIFEKLHPRTTRLLSKLSDPRLIAAKAFLKPYLEDLTPHQRGLIS